MKSGIYKVVTFSLIVIGIYILLGHYFFALSGGISGGVSGEVSAAAGKTIFWGKGKCSTCHGFGEEGSAVRCPNQGIKLPKFTAPIGIRAETRKPGMTGAEYIVESLYKPDTYVVRGFNKGLMKPINQPPIALSDDEITSVILYLIEKSEVEIDEEKIKEVLKAQSPFRGTGLTGKKKIAESIKFPEGDPEEGFDVFKEMKCFQCHFIKGVSGKIDSMEYGLTEGEMREGVGPELTDIGAIQSYEYLFESIVNPDAKILPDPSPDKKYSKETDEGKVSKMPSFLDTIKAQELIDMVAYLKSLGTTTAVGENR